MTYEQWAQAYPDAAAALYGVFSAIPWADSDGEGKSEQWAQQQARFDIARQGAMAWRNNVGATPAKIPADCPRCGHAFQLQQQPVRYGLANDSAKLNGVVKSSDLILAIPRVVTPDMVGRRIAQFGAVECKPVGWQYTGKGREAGQSAWMALIAQLGGFTAFSTGRVQL